MGNPDPARCWCTPRPGIATLAGIYWRHLWSGGGITTVLIDRPPRALRALDRLGICTPSAVLDLLQRFVPTVRFEAIEHDQAIRDYPALQAGAMEVTTDIAFTMETLIHADPYFASIARCIEMTGATSFVLKTLARTEIFPVVLAGLAADRQAGEGERGTRIEVMVPSTWPDSLVREFRDRTRLEARPLWRSRVARLIAKQSCGVRISLHSFGITVHMIARRGLRFRRRPREAWKLGLEFIDSDHLAGGIRDTDGMVHGRGLQPSDVVLFLTGAQVDVLAGIGASTRKQAIVRASAAAASRSYRLAVLDRVSFAAGELLSLARAIVPTTLRLAVQGATLGFLVAPHFLREYLDHLVFFSAHRPAKLLHVAFPNGAGSFRSNSGLVTGLARKNAVQTVGLQTRSVYLRKFEDSLDCYDLHLDWGPGYEEAAGPPGRAFIKERTSVGSTNLDAHLVRACRDKPENSRMSVLAFPVEIPLRGERSRSHYTFAYHCEYFMMLGRFAREHPDIDIRIKLKDAEDLARLQDEPTLDPLTGNGVSNIEFLAAARHDYSEVLASSDVVSAIGFTSPGTDSLLLNKPTVFFSRLGEGRGHLSRIPSTVASTWNEFNELLEQATTDPDRFVERQQVGMEEFDPFRDGQAMRRVAEILS